MTCPFCEAVLEPRGAHAHLVDHHQDVVTTVPEGDRLVYTVTCPQCQARYRRPIKKSAQDPQFVVEFDRQIRMVALDMLLTHLLAEHLESAAS